MTPHTWAALISIALWKGTCLEERVNGHGGRGLGGNTQERDRKYTGPEYFEKAHQLCENDHFVLFYYKMADFFTWGTQWATLSKMPNNLKPHVNSLEATVSF